VNAGPSCAPNPNPAVTIAASKIHSKASVTIALTLDYALKKRHQPNGQQRFSGPLSCHYQCHYSSDSTTLSGRCIVWPCKASLFEYW